MYGHCSRNRHRNFISAALTMHVYYVATTSDRHRLTPAWHVGQSPFHVLLCRRYFSNCEVGRPLSLADAWSSHQRYPIGPSKTPHSHGPRIANGFHCCFQCSPKLYQSANSRDCIKTNSILRILSDSCLSSRHAIATCLTFVFYDHASTRQRWLLRTDLNTLTIGSRPLHTLSRLADHPRQPTIHSNAQAECALQSIFSRSS